MVVERNKNYLLYRFLVSHIFIIIFALWGMDYEDIPVVWIVTVIIPNVLLSLVKNLTLIEIRSDDIQLVFNIWFSKKTVELYRFEDLTFTSKIECENKAWDTRFRIYKKGNEKSIISIGGVDEGYYEKEIEMIITELEKRGINVVTEKSK